MICWCVIHVYICHNNCWTMLINYMFMYVQYHHVFLIWIFVICQYVLYICIYMYMCYICIYTYIYRTYSYVVYVCIYNISTAGFWLTCCMCIYISHQHMAYMYICNEWIFVMYVYIWDINVCNICIYISCQCMLYMYI